MLPFCLNISTVKVVVSMGLKRYTAIVSARFVSARWKKVWLHAAIARSWKNVRLLEWFSQTILTRWKTSKDRLHSSYLTLKAEKQYVWKNWFLIGGVPNDFMLSDKSNSKIKRNYFDIEEKQRMEIKRYDRNFSVCKVSDFSGVNLNWWICLYRENRWRIIGSMLHRKHTVKCRGQRWRMENDED